MTDHLHVQEDERARDRMDRAELKRRVEDLERGALALSARVRELERKYADLIKEKT